MLMPLFLALTTLPGLFKSSVYMCRQRGILDQGGCVIAVQLPHPPDSVHSSWLTLALMYRASSVQEVFDSQCSCTR